MDKAPNMVRDTILLNLSVKSTTVTKLGFVRIINSRIRSFGHSLKSNPSIINVKYVQMHCDDFKIVFL